VRVGVRKPGEDVVETAVFLDDDDDVFDILTGSRYRRADGDAAGGATLAEPAQPAMPPNMRI
jgi:hypothetical protein